MMPFYHLAKALLFLTVLIGWGINDAKITWHDMQ